MQMQEQSTYSGAVSTSGSMDEQPLGRGDHNKPYQSEAKYGAINTSSMVKMGMKPAVPSSESFPSPKDLMLHNSSGKQNGSRQIIQQQQYSGNNSIIGGDESVDVSQYSYFDSQLQQQHSGEGFFSSTFSSGRNKNESLLSHSLNSDHSSSKMIQNQGIYNSFNLDGSNPYSENLEDYSYPNDIRLNLNGSVSNTNNIMSSLSETFDSKINLNGSMVGNNNGSRLPTELQSSGYTVDDIIDSSEQLNTTQ
jgi:hypothetical protein